MAVTKEEVNLLRLECRNCYDSNGRVGRGHDLLLLLKDRFELLTCRHAIDAVQGLFSTDSTQEPCPRSQAGCTAPARQDDLK